MLLMYGNTLYKFSQCFYMTEIIFHATNGKL